MRSRDHRSLLATVAKFMVVIRCTLESLCFHHVKGLTVTETDASSKRDDKLLLFRESLFFGLLPSTVMN